MFYKTSIHKVQNITMNKASEVIEFQMSYFKS